MAVFLLGNPADRLPVGPHGLDTVVPEEREQIALIEFQAFLVPEIGGAVSVHDPVRKPFRVGVRPYGGRDAFFFEFRVLQDCIDGQGEPALFRHRGERRDGFHPVGAQDAQIRFVRLADIPLVVFRGFGPSRGPPHTVPFDGLDSVVGGFESHLHVFLDQRLAFVFENPVRRFLLQEPPLERVGTLVDVSAGHTEIHGRELKRSPCRHRSGESFQVAEFAGQDGFSLPGGRLGGQGSVNPFQRSVDASFARIFQVQDRNIVFRIPRMIGGCPCADDGSRLHAGPADAGSEVVRGFPVVNRPSVGNAPLFFERPGDGDGCTGAVEGKNIAGHQTDFPVESALEDGGNLEGTSAVRIGGDGNDAGAVRFRIGKEEIDTVGILSLRGAAVVGAVPVLPVKVEEISLRFVLGILRIRKLIGGRKTHRNRSGRKTLPVFLSRECGDEKQTVPDTQRNRAVAGFQENGGFLRMRIRNRFLRLRCFGFGIGSGIGSDGGIGGRILRRSGFALCLLSAGNECSCQH